MTDEDRATLRDEIENLTIKQARARGEQAAETLRVLAELGIGKIIEVGPLSGSASRGAEAVRMMTSTVCPVCSRALGSATSLDECALGGECPALAASRPRARMSNKGPIDELRNGVPINGPIGASPPMTLEQRAAALAAPAFDANGEPLA